MYIDTRITFCHNVCISSGEIAAVKVLENVSEFIEEIEEEYLVLKDLGSEPNFPQFYGLYLKHATNEDVFPLKDQLWIAMEVV